MRRLTCDEAIAFLLRPEEAGALTPDERGALDAHLADCASCREGVDAQALVSAVLAARPVSPVPDGFAERLAARLSAERGWVGLADWQAWTLRLAPVAAAWGLVAFFAGGVASGRWTAEPTAPVSLAAVIEEWAGGGRAGGRAAASVLWQAPSPDDAVLLTLLTAAPDDPIAESAEAGGR